MKCKHKYKFINDGDYVSHYLCKLNGLNILISWLNTGILLMKKKMMRLAKKLAEKSCHKFRVGSIIVKGNKVLGIGFNKVKTSPQSTHPFKTRHAECDALISCGLENTSGATAYVYRLLKDGSSAMSKPCESCERMLKSRGIKKVYYTVDGDTWKGEKYG